MVTDESLTIDQVADLTTKILSDVKHTNEITRLVDSLGDQASDNLLVIALISALKKIYDSVLTNCWMFEVAGGTDEVSQYRIWMREVYEEVFTAITSHIPSTSPQVQEAAYSTALAFLSAETVFIKISRDRTAAFIEQIVLSESTELINKVSKEVSDLDWKYATLRAIERFSKKHSSQVKYSVLVYELLSSIDIAECLIEENRGKKTDASKTMQHICKAFNSTWIQFLKMNKTRGLYHDILSSLHDKVIPFMANPKLLIDFLVDSYDLGGISALLALNSLFILITKYNLDYPEFYPKLYRMLTPDVNHSEHVIRFISMLDTFLKSPLLPAYLVAAFVKRLTRNALQAPPHITIITLRLITNLLKLHPSVKRLVHRGPEHPSVREDPYQPDQQDPAKSGALDSSLWELDVLNDHQCPAVCAVVKTLRKPTDEILVDLGLEKGYDGLFKEYLKPWSKDPPVEFNEPKNFDKTEYSYVFDF